MRFHEYRSQQQWCFVGNVVEPSDVYGVPQFPKTNSQAKKKNTKEQMKNHFLFFKRLIIFILFIISHLSAGCRFTSRLKLTKRP